MNNSITNISNCPVIAGVSITTDKQGRFNLNALHKASGLGSNKAPAQWLRTQNAQDLVQELTDVQKCTSPINTIKGGVNQGTFVHELLAVSYAGWISAKFQIMVNQVFLDYKKGELKNTQNPFKSYLPEYRQARAMDLAVKALDRMFANLPHLGEQSKQVIYADTINSIAGKNVIPLPKLESKNYSATEVGQQLGISSNKIGRIAKELGLKTDEYGIFVLDKSRSSDKQVESFRYNDKAIGVIANYLTNKTAA